MPGHSFCSSCGFTLKNEYKFCPKCGLKSELGRDFESHSRPIEIMNQTEKEELNANYAPILPPAEPKPITSNTSPAKKKPNYLIYIITIIFVFILLIVGNTALFSPGFGGSKENQEAPTNSDYDICVNVTFDRKIALGWPVQMALDYSRQVCR